MNNGVWWAFLIPVVIVAGFVLRYIWIFRQIQRESFPREKWTPPLRGDYHDSERA